jgi:hypothetical protein
MRIRLLAVMALALLIVATLASAAGARPHHPGAYGVRFERLISGPSPFAGAATGLDGYEGETTITTNPRRPGDLVASWMQDLGGEAGARTNLIASSWDYGKTWKRTTIPGLTTFTGGTGDGSADPWLSAGPDGAVYVIGATITGTATGPSFSILSSTSLDGGRTWPRLTPVTDPDGRNDKPYIAADPRVPGRAYALFANWDRSLTVPAANLLYFARTDDRGASWSDKVLVDAPGPTSVDISSALLVLPGRQGTKLLAVYERVDLNADGSATERFLARRSSDGGTTWGEPVEIGSMPIAPIADPETGQGLPQPGFLSAAAGRDGKAYVAWERQESPTSGAIDVARSADGGRSWTVASLPGVKSFAFEPSIAVDGRGTVGITWYDLRNDKPGDAELSADVWFASSRDGARTWRETHLAGPTDLNSASLVRNNRFGEYQGLSAFKGSGFAAVYTLASPQAKDGETDVFFSLITSRHHHRVR